MPRERRSRAKGEMLTVDLDFSLPEELIAQAPPIERQGSRLLCYRRANRSIAHRRFDDLPRLLGANDLLVLNDTRVLPARFVLLKQTGGRVEGLFLSEVEPQNNAMPGWRVMLRNAGRARAGTILTFEAEPVLTATVQEHLGEGEYLLAVKSFESAETILSRIGQMPLPPYIKRHKGADERDEVDRARYQTVYARSVGAVAAPTAGLHFTPELLAALERRGVERAMVTLHVGVGTFKPVTADTLDGHRMHAERFRIDPSAADAINAAKAQGRRIVAVGSTSARVLESQPVDAAFRDAAGETSIFIYPPYQWKHVGALITNFHLPRSTLIAMVAAMVGLDEQRRIYREAIAQKYRFFSYGDAMLIE